MRIKRLVRDHWEWRKIVLEAKVHNRLWCCRWRKRRRKGRRRRGGRRRRSNRRKGKIIIHFNQYLLMYGHNSTSASYKASTKTVQIHKNENTKQTTTVWQQ
jgi:hypothetical protein